LEHLRRAVERTTARCSHQNISIDTNEFQVFRRGSVKLG